MLQNSPDFLYINPYDGCVKISSSFNLKETNLKYINYSVNFEHFKTLCDLKIVGTFVLVPLNIVLICHCYTLKKNILKVDTSKYH